MQKIKLTITKIFILVVFFTLGIFQITEAQSLSNCKVISVNTDTIDCDAKKMIVELNYCQESGLYQDGIVTGLNGEPEFCFFYMYNKTGELNKITFWTFEWIESGYRTKEKIANLILIKGKSKLVIKGKYELDYEFVKRITKTQ